MKVLQIGLSKNMGGVERFVYNYAEKLQQHGVQFDYVDIYGDGLAREEQLRQNGSEIYTIKSSLVHPVSTAKKIRKIVKDGDYCCVHVNMLSAANPVSAVAARWAGARVVVHCHSTKTIGIHRKVLHEINKGLLRSLPFVRLACGTAAGKWMFGKKKFSVCPNALDTERYRFCPERRQALRDELGVAENVLLLGFVGGLSAAKNPAYLAKILHAVKSKTDRPVKLLVVGDGEKMQELMETAISLGVKEDLLCVGVQQDTAGWYSAMDLFLLPSLFEGLPFVGVEAQTAGLPCLVSDQVPEELKITDLVRRYALTEDAANWAEKITGCCKTPEERVGYADEMAQKGYSLEKGAELLMKVYSGEEI